ncbi:hypothetical protein AO066_02870 [Pseudomonas fluorescens]|nr:hypothetical protein AO066_02870 [Pseudomonas fluorescens]
MKNTCFGQFDVVLIAITRNQVLFGVFAVILLSSRGIYISIERSTKRYIHLLEAATYGQNWYAASGSCRQ